MSALEVVPSPLLLTDLSVVAFRGPDARTFLQGQLSQDVVTLAVGDARLASLNNPQGRCLVIAYLVAESESDILAVTSTTQATTLQATLRRYVLRSKVRIEDESAHYRALGHWNRPPSADSTEQLTWPHTKDGRSISLQRADSGTDTDAAHLRAWQRADIAAGFPRLEPSTEGEFVAQMLNLDVLEAISFKKGCYTGQEVIARAHFRGRVKRRLQRFELEPAALESTACASTPGQSVTLSDGRQAAVINALATDTGQIACLAVTTFGGTPLPESRPLPYALPD
ncbi:MAG: folate-binding protein [Gammaproteobacteria bacterium]|jgi:folate-binding protein YgfZ|nr:folate-binding protein [Gammaproteobacteria bacterium]